MKNKKLFYLILGVIILAAVMAVLLICTRRSNFGQAKIQTDINEYALFMNSTVGIGLTPMYTPGINSETVKFHWYTNYGYFLSWGAPDFKVYGLGTEVINSGEKIYWSYSPDEMNVKKPSVKISLRVEDAKSGKLLAVSSLEIDWKDIYYAEVKK